MTTIERLVQDVIRICSVAAPTGREERRAELVLQMMHDEGLTAALDGFGSVVAEIPGDPALPTIAVAAHLDTVFPDEGEIEVRREGDVLVAPGIGDNSAGVAALVALARDLPREGLGRVFLVATVGEEGLGDLRGARRFVDDHGEELDAFLALEGAMRERVVTVAIGSERLRFTLSGPGGHSWGDADAPSAILGAARLVEALYDLKLPRHPRTTLSVGTLQAGHSVNSIAADAVMDVDLRSVNQASVIQLRRSVLETVENLFPPAAPLRCTSAGIGSRPAGILQSDHPLLDHVQSARAEAGLPPAEETSSSTDANIPLSRGIPAACVGVGFGHDAHKRSETLEIPGLLDGLRALLNLVERAGSDRILRRPR